MRPTGQLARDAWAETYARRGVWWGRPEDLTAARLRAWAGELWLGAIVRAAEIRPGPDVRVLEAGCGTAQYALALALQGCRVDALDVNATALERAAELAEGVGVTNEVRLLEGDLIAMPTADDAYDLVFNQQVMEYFVDDRTRQAAFADMVRTTKPGGRVVVVVARPAHPFARWWGLLGWPGFTDQPDMIELERGAPGHRAARRRPRRCRDGRHRCVASPVVLASLVRPLASVPPRRDGRRPLARSVAAAAADPASLRIADARRRHQA